MYDFEYEHFFGTSQPASSEATRATRSSARGRARPRSAPTGTSPNGAARTLIAAGILMTVLTLITRAMTVQSYTFDLQRALAQFATYGLAFWICGVGGVVVSGMGLRKASTPGEIQAGQVGFTAAAMVTLLQVFLMPQLLLIPFLLILR